MPGSLPRVGICHAPHAAANLREIVSAARDLCRPVVLVRKSVAESDPGLVQVARQLFECHVHDSDPDAILADLGLDAATTYHDEELELADALQARLRPAAASTVPAPWDKLVQRQLLGAQGLTRVRAVPIDNRPDLEREFARFGEPCVLKPRRAAGGSGVAFLRTDADVRHQLANREKWTGLLLETVIEPGRHPAGVPWLGDIISVETMSAGSTRVHLGVLDKLPVAVTHRAGPGGTDAVSVPGDLIPSRLDPRQTREAVEVTNRALDALDVRDRITHTELCLTTTGIEVLEVNGRVAGHTTRLFRLVDGPDLVRLALVVALGGEAEVDVTVRGAAAGLFPGFPDRTGTVRSTASRQAVHRIPGVVGVHELATHGQPRSAAGSRIANVTVRGGDHGSLDDAVCGVLRELARMFHDDGVTANPLLGWAAQ